MSNFFRKTIAGIDWVGVNCWAMRSLKPERYLEFRVIGLWVCDRLLPMGEKDVWLSGRGKTPAAAVRKLLAAERKLAKELTE